MKHSLTTDDKNLERSEEIRRQIKEIEDEFGEEDPRLEAMYDELESLHREDYAQILKGIMK